MHGSDTPGDTLSIHHQENRDSDKDAVNAAEKALVSPFQGPPHPSDDPNIVSWDGPDDPENPQNWSQRTKWTRAMVIASMTLVVTFSSSVFSTGTLKVSKEFHISTEVSTLGTSLFVLGFGMGPTVWGPLSEIFGRTRPLFFAYFCFAIFQIPVAVAQNVETIMTCRWLGGVSCNLASLTSSTDHGLALRRRPLGDYWWNYGERPQTQEAS